jgi:hypothetical protein
MSNTANSIKSLRKYYKDRHASIDPQHLFAELTGESDRAVVILLSSVLDDMLAHLLRANLSFSPDQPQMEHIFRFEGPLGTFSARAEIAYLFGLIDEATKEQLDVLREMRNACAHSKQKIDFGISELAAVAKRLVRQHRGPPLKLDTRKQIREAFTVECVFIGHLLAGESREEAESALQKTLALPSPLPGTLPQR